MKPSTLNRRSVWIVALTRTPSTGINASRLRSPGSSMIPDRTASCVDVSINSLPSQSTRPAFGGCRPARQSKSWGWPLPSAPATPTISPLFNVKLTGPNDWPWRPSTTRTSRASPVSGAGGGNAASNGRPTIRSTNSGSVVPRASNVPWFRPSRRTVIRSAISSTSGRRWLTYTTPTPRSRHAAIVRCSASTSLGPSAVVGSSSRSTFGSVTSAFATSKS